MRVLSGHDQAWLWEQLAHLIRLERPLVAALKELAESNAGTRRGQAAQYLADALAAGATLPQAIGAHERRFFPGVKVAIEAAHGKGNLVEVLESQAEAARTDARLRYSVAEVIAYPVVVAFVALAAIVVLNVKLVPFIREITEELGIHLPDATRVLPGALQVESFFLLLAPSLVLTVLYLFPPGRMRWLDGVRLKLPILGRAMQRLLLARWCGKTGMLLMAGVSEPEAVLVAGKASGNTRVSAISRRLAEKLAEGQPLSEAIRQEDFFPAELAWMIAMAARRGGYTDVWPIARETYGEQGARTAYIGSVVLKVVFIILALQIVSVTAISLFLPLMSLMNALGG